MPYLCMMAALISLGDGAALVPLFTISTVSPTGTLDALLLQVTFHRRDVAIVLSSTACNPNSQIKINMKKA